MTQSSTPKISVIIPTYNRASYLIAALDSALQQDYPNMEIIVADNASSDGTPEVIQSYVDRQITRLKYFRNENNIGMVGNWRRCLNQHATGDWFLILSDDDYLTDNRYLSKAAELIMKDASLMIVYANGIIVDELTGRTTELNLPFKEVEAGSTIFFHRETFFPQDFTLCNVLFRRDPALKLDAFSNDYNISCDSELFLELCLLGNVGVIHDQVSVYRKHGNNLFNSKNSNWLLFVHNLDYILEPYKLARSMKTIPRFRLAFFFMKNIAPQLLNAVLDISRLRRIDFIAARTVYQGKINTLSERGISTLSIVEQLFLRIIQATMFITNMRKKFSR